MYDAAVETKSRTWNQVQDSFLRAMESFDDIVVAGGSDWGDRQNGKGDFFNDLLALLLENCAGVTLYSRGSVPGLIIPKHHLDVTFPPEGVVEFMLEAKAVGTPKHPDAKQSKPPGRAGSADLDKRVKEIGFKAIDLKAEYGRMKSQAGQQTEAIGDLTVYLRAMKPISFVFFAARVISPGDLARVIAFGNIAAQVSDAVGIFAYKPIAASEWTRYESAVVPPHLQLERQLHKACQELVRLKGSKPELPAAPSPSQKALEIPVPEAGSEEEGVGEDPDEIDVED